MVTSTELGYLSGVTSNIQDQLNGKALSGHDHETWTVSNSKTYFYQHTIEKSNNCIGYKDPEGNTIAWFGLNTNTNDNPTNRLFVAYSFDDDRILSIASVYKDGVNLFSEPNVTFSQTGFINIDPDQDPTYPIIGAYTWGDVFSLTRRLSDGSYQAELIGFNTENGAILLPTAKNTGCYGISYPSSPAKGQLFLLKSN